MDAVTMNILKQVAIWLALIIMTIIMLDRLTNGYVIKYIIAKIGKNRNGVLVRVWGIAGYRYRNGKIMEKTKLRYKGTDGIQRMYNLTENSVIDEAGVNTVWVFETQNAVMNHKTKKLEFQLDVESLKKLSEDGVKTIPIDIPVEEIQENPDVNDMFYEECLMRPGKEKPRIVDWIIIGLCGLTILLLWWHNGQIGKQNKAIYEICSMAFNNTVSIMHQTAPLTSGTVNI